MDFNRRVRAIELILPKTGLLCSRCDWIVQILIQGEFMHIEQGRWRPADSNARRKEGEPSLLPTSNGSAMESDLCALAAD
jgi:hypothetical protein